MIDAEKDKTKNLTGVTSNTGTEITQSRFGEVVTRNNDTGSLQVSQSEWVQFKSFNEDQMEGKSGASSRGNSSSISVY